MNRKIILLIVIAIVGDSSFLSANTGGEVSALSVGIDILLLIAGLLCFSASMKVFSLLKGGELSSGWQLVAISFLAFSVAQALKLAIELEFVSINSQAINVLSVVAIFLVFIGFVRIKKSLS